MIFVTLGTQDKQFKRLLDAVENINIDEKIIMQTGSTNFATNKKNIEIHDFLSLEKFNTYMKEARIVITHAGVGTIIAGLKMNKKMIVAPRLQKYNEHVNDHQLQILETFAKDKYIIPLNDFSKLEELVNTDFEPEKFKSNNKNFIDKLDNEINKLLKNKWELSDKNFIMMN